MEPAELQWIEQEHKFHCKGSWTVRNIANIEFPALKPATSKTSLILCGNEITDVDTAGLFLLHKLEQQLIEQGYTLEKQGFDTEQSALMTLVEKKSENLVLPKPRPKIPRLEAIGRASMEGYKSALEFLAFIGETCVALFYSILSPRRLRWTALLNVVESAGSRAIFIIGLLSFLIGMVLVYQMGLQLRNYGATIYVADILGVSLLREFSPLLTAIIIAGRTGSAFTAQIGTMKVNEEIDALRTFGLSSTELLLLPRMLALIIVLPLLTVVSEITGVVGGMLVSKSMLQIPYTSFIDRFQEAIPLKTYVLGMIKVPIFATIIAMVGCFQGLKVSGSAESVGQRTTVSVVHSIFLIIVADAAMSIVYSWYDL